MNAAELLDFLFPNTEELRGARALCVSHVYPATGTRLPLKDLRRKADELGIQYLIVDGAQAFGMIDLSQGSDSISHADFYACPGHKWLNGPPGTGILFIQKINIRPPEFYPTLSQMMSKYSFDADTNARPFPMAEALQVRGCSNAPGFSAMLRAIEFTKELGGSRTIEELILSLSTEVKDFIMSQSAQAMISPYQAAELQSGLTVFFPFSWKQPDKLFTDKKTADFVVRELLKLNIQIRSIGFADSALSPQKVYALRVSTGIFNTSEQIDGFQKALRNILLTL
jgi:selenocysteine lyase/cysteine desulfurase